MVLTLAFVPVKGLRNEIIIEKGTELGVTKFLPFKSEFSEIPALSSTKLRRFRNIAISAMLQSQRYNTPEITYQDDINTFVASFGKFDCVLLADKNGKPNIPSKAGSILYIVGPEGGFADSEIEQFKKNGAQLLSLGPTRLRSETAAIAGVVKILAALGAI
jgi:16S rRNA (uracil1498-N3)-methyltransferase